MLQAILTKKKILQNFEENEKKKIRKMKHYLQRNKKCLIKKLKVHQVCSWTMWIKIQAVEAQLAVRMLGFHTVLSRERLSASRGVLAPTFLFFTSSTLHLVTSEEVGEEQEWKTRLAFLLLLWRGLLTKWAVSPAESGERRTGIRPQRMFPVPLPPLLLPQSPTGEPPEVNPSSAELRSPCKNGFKV